MRRRTFVQIAAGAALGAVGLAAGAGECKKKPPYPDVTLCGNCGQVKGSADCCKQGATLCKACGLHKGSPGCCRIKKGKMVTLCGNCGQCKGSDLCCCKKPDQPRCKGCGLFSKSPGCCRINAPAVQKAAMAQAEAKAKG